MWRNLSSKLVGKANSTSCQSVLHASPRPHYHASLARSTSTGPPSTSAAHPANWIPSESTGARAVASDLPSISATSMLNAQDMAEVAKHYGRCYWELSKARLSMLVVATSGTGFILGSGSSIDYLGLCCTCAGTMMVAASANSLNQVFEVKNDAKMMRTRNRPLPSGRMTITHAATWASSVGIAGTAVLACEIHPVNTWVGAIVGAIPPLLGWAAASGQVSLNAMLLPAALYFWQLPHFMALAYLCRKDYADGGYRMLSLGDTSGRRTALVALRNFLYLLPLGYLAYDWGVTSSWFCAESTLLALAISSTSASFYLNRTTQSARRMFHASLLYLPVFMGGLLIHRVSDNEQSLTMDSTDPFLHLTSSDTKPSESPSREKRKPRPPVAYASAAPFPFLPAPSYVGY